MRIILCFFSFWFLFACNSPKENTTQQNLVDTSDAFQKISVLNEKIRKDPNNAVLYYDRATIYFQEKNIESSLNDLNRAFGIDSANADFYLLLADIHFIKKEGIKAKEVLNKCIEIEPRKTEAYLKLAEIYFMVEQFGKSIEYINTALKIDVHNAKAYFMKGMNYKYAGDTANAISSMQTAVEQNNDYYDAFMQLGLLFADKNDSLAIHYYDNALRVHPLSIEAQYGKSLYLQEHGQPEKAIEGYHKILENDKNNFVIHFNIGYVNLVELENFEEARKNFTKAIELNPNYFEAFCNRGVVYEKMSNSSLLPSKQQEFLKNAEADFRKSLEIKPDYTPAAKGISRVVDKEYD